MPEINRFRRGDSFEKSRAYECLFGASSFAEFLTYMASLREGSRGGEVTAMGGWQWGSGMALPAYARTTEGGWIPASVFAGAGSPRMGYGDGSPHTRGQRVGGGFPLSSADLRGGDPAYARTTGGGGSRFPLPSTGRGGRLSVGGMGMGPRIREDNGWGWVPASVFTGAGISARTTGWGWVPAFRPSRGQDLDARTTGGDGSGDGRFANRPYGRRILSGTGFTPIPRLHEGRL